MNSEYKKCPDCGWETKHSNGTCKECGRESDKKIYDPSLLKMDAASLDLSVRCTACGETDRVRDPDDWVCLSCGCRNQRDTDKSLGFKPKLDLSKLKLPLVLEDKEEEQVIVDGNFLLYRLEAEVPSFAEGEVPDPSYRADNV